MKLSDSVSAEAKFRAAFDRLKNSVPQVLSAGTPVSQNNVAKEAGVDPSALRKSRFSSLISEIQAYVEIQKRESVEKAKSKAVRAQRRLDLKSKLEQVTKQRDDAQSQLVQLQFMVIDLSQRNAKLESEVESLRPPVTMLRR
ncbi:hypothetical protein ACFWP0_07220 [Achromobacter sp. NPDC058515]|uniref:hypothetical protein n=1 Tax=Achromobacter sp. NPDC058515 TaxID=3346533 RepID=UPI0036508FC1